MLTISGRGGFGVDRGFNKLTNTHVCGVWFVNLLQLLGWGRGEVDGIVVLRSGCREIIFNFFYYFNLIRF